LGALSWFAAASGGSPIAVGNSFTTPILSATTTYYVQDSTCAVSLRTPITVNVNSIPTVLSTLGGSRCGSGVVLLHASASVGTLAWYDAPSGGTQLGTGANFTTPVIPTTTTYYVGAVNGGCLSGRVAVTATVVANSSSTLTATACNHFVSANGQVFTASGTYLDTIANMAGCDSLMTLQLTIVSLDTTLTLNGTTITANQSGLAYQWLDCNNGFAVIPSQTAQSFNASTTSNYAVALSNGLCADTSACMAVTVIPITDAFGAQLLVFPSPTTGKLMVYLEGGLSGAEMSLWDMTGRLLSKTEFHQRAILQIDGAAGVYLLRVMDATGNIAYRRIEKITE
jgi:hypothetical protein